MSDVVADPLLAVCVLFFEKLEQTIECVSSFRGAGVPIYVLDNGSAAASAAAFAEFGADEPEVRILRSEQNLGVSGGRNRLLADTTEPWLLFADNDLVMRSPDWLAALARCLREDPAVEAWIPRLYNVHEGQYVPPLRLVLSGQSLSFEECEAPDTNVFPGGAALVSREVFQRLGPYDERLFVGFEDIELAVRALRTGSPIRARRTPAVEMHHDHRFSSKALDLEVAEVRYSTSTVQSSFAHLVAKHDLVYRSHYLGWIRRERERFGVGG